MCVVAWVGVSGQGAHPGLERNRLDITAADTLTFIPAVCATEFNARHRTVPSCSACLKAKSPWSAGMLALQMECNHCATRPRFSLALSAWNILVGEPTKSLEERTS